MMKTTLTLALLVLLSFCAFEIQAQTHDPAACNSADVISCGTNFNNHSNRDASNRLEVYSCSGRNTLDGYNGNERIYILEVSLRQQYDIRLDDVDDPELNFDLFLMREDCRSGDCMMSSTNDENTPERILTELNPGTYYLIVDTWEGEVGTYDLSVECGTPPSFGNCQEARSIWCDELLSGNTWGESNDFDADVYNCYGGTGTYNGGDVIYSFTKRRAADHIQLHLFTEASNLNIFLVSRCDENGFSCAAVGKDFNGGKFIDEEDLGLPAGEYYVIVDGRNSATDGAYSILLSCDEYDFSDAEELICGKPKENQNFTGSRNQQSLYTCNGNNQQVYNGGERVYYFDLATTTEISLELDKTSTFGELGLFLFEEGTNRPVCLASGTRYGGDSEINILLNRGRYYVIVDNIKEAFFDLSFTGCVCPVDGSLTCDEPINGSNAGGGDDVLYTAGSCQTGRLRIDAQDRVYEFTAAESREYTFRLYNLEKDLGLFLFEDCNNPETCIGFSNRNGSDEVAIFLEADQTVYVTVDGVARLVTSSFTLDVLCTGFQDADSDGIADELDNCVFSPNSDQADLDGDGLGDVCDADDDNDGVPDGLDCAPMDANIAFSIGDACDDGNEETINDAISEKCICEGEAIPDSDGDGINDDQDNCVFIANADQVDTDGDGMGDVCDEDDDNDGTPDTEDCAPLNTQLVSAVGDSCDDGNPETVNDRVIEGCQCVGDAVGSPEVNLTVGSGSGGVGDTVCVDITATGFEDVSAATFSVIIDSDFAKIVSVTNENLTGGTFTGSHCAVFNGNVGGLVVWSAEGGQSVTLDDGTAIVEVCAELLSSRTDKADLVISSDLVPAELFDLNTNPIDLVTTPGVICAEANLMNITGTVMNIAENAMSDVAIDVTGTMSASVLSNAEGAYEIPVTDGASLEVRPSSTDDFMEHVSVMDVLFFRQHFIFQRSFESPYQYIAADIDGNGRLSIRDEQLMKRMILGLDESGYPLWRFVKADHEWPEIPEFSTGGPVFDYPNYAVVDDLQESMTQDFIGIRMGDLQLSDLMADSRSTETAGLIVSNQAFTSGQHLSVPFKIADGVDLAGLSVELNFDPATLKFEGFTTDLPGDQEEMFTTRFEEEGKIIVQWIGDVSVDVTSLQDVFEMQFASRAIGTLADHLYLSSTYRPSELVDSELQAKSLYLDFSEMESTFEIELYPNPTSNISYLQFESANDVNGAMNVYSINGSRLMNKSIPITTGANLITIDKSEFGIQEGLIYIELNTGERIIRKSLLILK